MAGLKKTKTNEAYFNNAVTNKLSQKHYTRTADFVKIESETLY